MLVKPMNLHEFAGNLSIKKQLNDLKEKPKAILITGKSGCGKSVLARLIAKKYSSSYRESVDEYLMTGDVNVTDDIFEYSLDYYYIPYTGLVIVDDVEMLPISTQTAIYRDTSERALSIFCVGGESKVIDRILNYCDIKLNIELPERDEILAYLMYCCEKVGKYISTDELYAIIDGSSGMREMIVKMNLEVNN